jgi:hypothetical protein
MGFSACCFFHFSPQKLKSPLQVVIREREEDWSVVLKKQRCRVFQLKKFRGATPVITARLRSFSAAGCGARAETIIVLAKSLSTHFLTF